MTPRLNRIRWNISSIQLIVFIRMMTISKEKSPSPRISLHITIDFQWRFISISTRCNKIDSTLSLNRIQQYINTRSSRLLNRLTQHSILRRRRYHHRLLHLKHLITSLPTFTYHIIRYHFLHLIKTRIIRQSQ
jgi:hypothetical protein